MVNFFRVLRERPDDLVRLLSLTPYARAECELSYEIADDPLEDARRLYIRCYMSMGATMNLRRRSGWRIQAKAENLWRSAAAGFSDIDHLHAVADRFRGVQIECDDAFTVIERFDRPGTLFYLDPPYVASTRSKQWSGAAYQHEMSDEDHRELARISRAMQGFVVLSGYPCELYHELYHGWEMLEIEARTNGSGARIKTEGLWLSPRTAEHQRQVQRLLL